MRAYVVAILALLAGCEEPSPPAQPPRPVESTVIRSAPRASFAFAGTVEARTQTEQAFQVLGRVVARPVKVGDVVRQGDLLAALDPTSLHFQVTSAGAQVASEQASLANAKGRYERQVRLFDARTVSEAEVEDARQAYLGAGASTAQAEGNLAKAREQLLYAELRAAYNGIVRSVEVEVGQTVSTGAPAVTLARLGSRDVVLDVTDSAIGAIEVGGFFETSLQLAPEFGARAQVREIAPDADPITRTRRVRLTLIEPPEAYRLGSTVTAAPLTSGAQGLRMPAAAMWGGENDEGPHVWTVDPQTSRVAATGVEIGERHGSTVEVRSGLVEGSRVVTAGIGSLQEGQLVRFGEDGTDE